MLSKSYKNFVRASSFDDTEDSRKYYPIGLSGDQAQREYLEVITTPCNSSQAVIHTDNLQQRPKRRKSPVHLDRSKILLAVQNNDSETVESVLESQPDTLNMIDEFGWSLLMIACRANAVETVKILLDKGADTSIKDKAGNTVYTLADKGHNPQMKYMLSCYTNIKYGAKHKEKPKCASMNYSTGHYSQFYCDVCSNNYTSKKEHLSSTVHNLNVSKRMELRSWYGIPETNKGFAILLKNGWDRERGLGPNGTGKKYPIKTVQKQDRKGLGHGKVKPKDLRPQETPKVIPKKQIQSEKHHKNFERNFRREFM